MMDGRKDVISMTMCRKCAKKSSIRKEAYDSSDHHVLQGMGPDSLCDFCGEGNGGSVIWVKKEKTRVFLLYELLSSVEGKGEIGND
jgi:hypothetical protein